MLVGVLAWSAWNPLPAPFSYRLVEEGKPADFPSLKLDEKAAYTIRRYEIRVPDVDKPVADFHLADAGASGPVLLEWRNHLTEPVLTLSSKLSELKTLAAAVDKHVSEGTLVAGWWDTSRRLELLSKTDVLFRQNLARPVLIPHIWEGRREMIEADERVFWKVPATAPATDQFNSFTDALLSTPEEGAAKLKALAGGRELIVAVHITDAFKLGALAPNRFAIGYKDFASAAKIHGMVKHVKDWVKRQGYKAYTVLPLNDEVRRVFFLADKSSTETMLAQLLPFNTSNPFEMKAMRLVYQHGGYWVYKLSASTNKTALK